MDHFAEILTDIRERMGGYMKYFFNQTNRYSKYLLLPLILLMLSEKGLTQSTTEIKRQNFSKHILANSEVGYLTFLGGLGNIGSLWFEGVLVPSYSLRINENAKWGAVLVPKIVIRMYRKDSQPIIRQVICHKFLFITR